MTDTTAAISIDPERLAEIDALATSTDRTRDEVVREAIDEYLYTSAWQMERIEAGLAAVREGRVVPAEEVYARLAARYGWSD